MPNAMSQEQYTTTDWINESFFGKGSNSSQSTFLENVSVRYVVCLRKSHRLQPIHFRLDRIAPMSESGPSEWRPLHFELHHESFRHLRMDKNDGSSDVRASRSCMVPFLIRTFTPNCFAAVLSSSKLVPFS